MQSCPSLGLGGASLERPPSASGCGRYAPTGLRDRALIVLLYRAGLRINEALSLYLKDLDLTDGCIRVLNGKGGRSRTVGVPNLGVRERRNLKCEAAE